MTASFQESEPLHKQTLNPFASDGCALTLPHRSSLSPNSNLPTLTAPSPSVGGTATPSRTSQPPSNRLLALLAQNLLYALVAYLDPSDLSALAATCFPLARAVKSVLGFVSCALAPPSVLSPTRLPPMALDGAHDLLTHDIPLGFPRKLPHHQGTVQIGDNVYAPLLGAKPGCSVLDVRSLRERDGKGTPGSGVWRLPEWVKLDIEWRGEGSWVPLMAPAVGIGRRIYFFGGIKYDLAPQCRSSLSSLYDGSASMCASSEASTEDSEASSYFEFHGVHSKSRGSAGSATAVRTRWKLPERPVADQGSSDSSSRSGSRSELMKERTSASLYWLDTGTLELHQVHRKENEFWPRAVKNHVLEAVRERYLIVFGGKYAGGEEENSVHAFDTFQETWSTPHVTGSPPLARFGASSTHIRDHIHIFGGATFNMPNVHVFGDLHRLDCSQITEGTLHWTEYEAPLLWNHRRGPSQQPRRTQSSCEWDVNDEFEPNLDSETLQDASRVGTSGPAPLERIEATLMAVGPNKLVVLGGRTVDVAQLPLTGSAAAWEESFSWNLSTVDCFNVTARHWSRVAYEGPASEDPAFGPFLRDLAHAAPVLLQGGEAWGILCFGQRLVKEDFTERLSTSLPGFAIGGFAPMPSSPEPFPPTLEEARSLSSSLPIRASPTGIGAGRMRDQGLNWSSTGTSGSSVPRVLMQPEAPHAYITVYYRDESATLLSCNFHLQTAITFETRKGTPHATTTGGAGGGVNLESATSIRSDSASPPRESGAQRGDSMSSIFSEMSRDRGLSAMLPVNPFFRILVLNR